MEQPAITSKNDAMYQSLVIYKGEEKLISESLYRNLHVLCRFSEPTAEFLSVSTPHMFIKSNPKAFLVVMHFIFNCLDAVEFGKRFIWPIFDKTGETNFRKAALDYMNHLNVVHQLGLETLKLSNIHIPGGLKFIKIIHKFTFSAMKLEVNKPERGPLQNLHNIPDGDDILAKLEQYVERGMDYAARLQVQSRKLWERIDEMHTMMESCLDVTAESKKEKTCWACQQKKWKNQLDCVVRDDVVPQLEVVNLLSKNTVQLNQILPKLFVGKQENIVEYDRDQLVIAQKCLKNIHPDFGREIDGIVDGNFVDFASLFKVFSLLLPNIITKLDTFTERHIEVIQYEWNEIVETDAIASKYQDAANEYKDLLQPFNEKQLENFLKFCQNNFNLPFNLMGTPVVTRRLSAHRVGNRILIDDSTNRARLFNESAVQKAPKRTSSRSSLGGCKSHDAAMQLLAKPKSRSNLSMSSMPNMSALHHPFSTPKLSSTMATNRLHPQSEFKLSPNFPMTPTRSLIQPIIQSPSRRFSVNEIPSEFAAMMQAVTDSIKNSVEDCDSFFVKFQNVNLDEIIKIDHVGNIGNGRNLQKLNVNGKNESSGMNNEAGLREAASTLSSRQTNEFGVEFIDNISDSVLHDILSDQE